MWRRFAPARPGGGSSRRPPTCTPPRSSCRSRGASTAPRCSARRWRRCWPSARAGWSSSPSPTRASAASARPHCRSRWCEPGHADPAHPHRPAGRRHPRAHDRRRRRAARLRDPAGHPVHRRRRAAPAAGASPLMPRTAPSDGRRRLQAGARIDATNPRMRKGLGSPALFGIVQGFVAASVYFSVGVVAERALGLTWLVFLAGIVLFALVVVSYVEGASLHQERGGATVIARYAFNELWSFVAGWAICLDYLILIALTAFTVADYASVFWSELATGVPEFLVGLAVIGYVAFTNLRGTSPRRYERAVIVVLADLALQLVILALGFALLFEPQVLTHPAGVAGAGSLGDLIWAFPLVLVAFSGIDASSGLAGQVAVGRKGLRRLVVVRFTAALIPYVGMGLLASSTLPVERFHEGGAASWIEAPVLGVVADFSQAWLREPLRYLVALSAMAILIAACQAAMLGLSRLGYNLATNRQIPSLVGYLHPRFGTPVVIITIGAVLAVILIMPADLEFLLGISAFGATLAFTLVCAGVCRLR